MQGAAPPEWLAQIGALLGVGSLGAILLKLIEKMFARADKGDELAIGLRAEMLRRLTALEKSQAELEKRERAAYERSIALEAENRQLRRRFHQFVQWLSAQPGLPSPPAWLLEAIDGPTADEWRRPMNGDQPPRSDRGPTA